MQHALSDTEITEDFGEFLMLLEEASIAYANPGDSGWTSLTRGMRGLKNANPRISSCFLILKGLNLARPQKIGNGKR